MKINFRLTRKKIYIIILIGLVTIAGINSVSWLFLQSFESDLTKALKNQILHIGQLTTRLIDGNDIENIYRGMENSTVVLFYQQLLYDIKINNDLENIVLLDPAGSLLVDHRLNYIIGDTLYTFPLQLKLLQSASLGEISEPEMTRIGNQYFLSVYLPILNDFDEPVAVLVIEAPLKFFSTLQKLEIGTLYLGFTGIIILISFSIVIVLATRRLFQAEDRMQEQERLAQLGQMAASVAHEIRNPLSIIKGTADVLQKKYHDLSDEMFSFIPDEIERLNHLVDEFLQFARQRKLDIQKYSLSELLEDFLHQIKDERFKKEVDQSIPRVYIDANAIKQILLNIINNALESVDSKGKVNLRVYLERKWPQRVVIEVADNGKGIAEKDLPHVFEPFFSTKASGSGLGLAISKQLIEQMGGNIEINSEEGKGTSVSIKLKAFT
jgi:signal transduction histidine kinase